MSIISVIVSFLFHFTRKYHYAGLSIIAYLLHRFVSVPLYVTFIVLGVWFLDAALTTWLYSRASYYAATYDAGKEKKNINPYSKNNDDVMKRS